MKENPDNNQHSLRQLEITNLKFELNPHTFKNILQQIQSLSLSTNRAIENLMQILNYMLYDTDKEQVALQQEIDFVIAFKKMQQAIVPGFVDIIFVNDIEESFLQRKAIAPYPSGQLHLSTFVRQCSFAEPGTIAQNSAEGVLRSC